MNNGQELEAFPTQKYGSKVLLSEDLDKKLQVYLTKLREAVLARIVSGRFRHLEKRGEGSAIGAQSTAENFWVASPTSGHVNSFMTHTIIVVAS